MGGWFGGINLAALGTDAFVTKLDPNGNFLWAKGGGGSWLDRANGLALDAAANCYITGFFSRDATFGTTVLDNVNDSNDVFVAKLDADGNWIWAIRSGGANYETAQAIDVSPSGRCFITGRYMGSTSFGPHSLTSSGSNDWEIFVAALGVLPPLAPDGLELTKTGDDILLQWTAVTENINGTPITPLHYNVYYASLPDPDAPVTLLESVAGTSYAHTGGALGSETRSYLVKAVLAD
jgi:ribosomal protein S11